MIVDGRMNTNERSGRSLRNRVILSLGSNPCARKNASNTEAAQIARALIDERKREEFAAPEMATVARKNGAGDAPELKAAGPEPLRKSQNGHG